MDLHPLQSVSNHILGDRSLPDTPSFRSVSAAQYQQIHSATVLGNDAHVRITIGIYRIPL
jgi:hypothetical protein